MSKATRVEHDGVFPEVSTTYDGKDLREGIGEMLPSPGGMDFRNTATEIRQRILSWASTMGLKERNGLIQGDWPTIVPTAKARLVKDAQRVLSSIRCAFDAWEDGNLSYALHHAFEAGQDFAVLCSRSADSHFRRGAKSLADTRRGGGAKPGAGRRKKLPEDSSEILSEVDRIRVEHPDWSAAAVNRTAGERWDVNGDAIRKRLKKMADGAE